MPRVTHAGRYSQKQAADALGVCPKTIRRYEQRGLLKFFVRQATMTKVTTGSEIIRLWNVMH